MLTTIDRAGRIVVPKALRDALSLGDGAVVHLRLEDGRIIMEPAPVPKEIVVGPHGPVVRSSEPVPAMTAHDVRAALDDIRR